MLAYAASMNGQSELAMQHIRAMVRELPTEFVKEFAPMVEGFAAMPLEVMIRFGQWDAILAEPDDYADYMPFCRAMHSAARAIAYAAKEDSAAARREQAAFAERRKLVSEEATFGNNAAQAILEVAGRMLEGEILFREGEVDKALAELRAAVKLEDALKYDEPPGWLVPVRHPLGATLMKEGRFAEAEQVYRDDLAKLPENGWALFGLAQSLRAQGKPEAQEMQKRFEAVWAHADIEIPSSCMCQQIADARARR
jgi:tetratricopeptide (TPR) repeat protein